MEVEQHKDAVVRGRVNDVGDELDGRHVVQLRLDRVGLHLLVGLFPFVFRGERGERGCQSGSWLMQGITNAHNTHTSPPTHHTHLQGERGGEGEADRVEVVRLQELPDRLARDGPEAVGHLFIVYEMMGCKKKEASNMQPRIANERRLFNHKQCYPSHLVGGLKPEPRRAYLFQSVQG